MTRAEYLSTSAQPGSFAQYYGEIIAEVGGPDKFHLPCDLSQIKAALVAGDEHLNTIRLRLWDMLHMPQGVAAALKARGDYLTLGNSVCLSKEAARLRASE